MDMAPGRKRLVFLVDDQAENIAAFRYALSPLNYELRSFGDGQEVLDAVRSGVIPDLVVTDVVMPRLDGFALTAALKSHEPTRLSPVILVTGLDDVNDKIRGLEAGADDFLSKPFHPTELRVRVRSLMRIRELTDELDQKNRILLGEKGLLEEMVRERTEELERLTIGIVAALEKANELKDSDTGLHIMRVCSYSGVVATAMGLDAGYVAKVRRYASLHDVGKVGIPDSILKKQGKLSPEEYEQMKMHTVFGHELLRLAGADEVACNIALSHHEKFDGNGYPHGLAGEKIPLEARIVAIADVYDALTTRRCYKEAYQAKEAEGIIREESGRHFDPRVVEAMLSNIEQFNLIREQYAEPLVSVSLSPREAV